MSEGLYSSVANYGGRQPDNYQNIKQFWVSDDDNIVPWIYNKLSSAKNVNIITPSNNKHNLYISTSLTIDKNLTVNGTFSNPSDKNLKSNINSLDTNKTDNILKLNPVTYNYNNDNEKKQHFGLIAQEIEEFYPELVRDDFFYKDNFYKTINYIELIPIMVSKIKNMQNEIDELKKKYEKI
jgi:hypothetical protein